MRWMAKNDGMIVLALLTGPAMEVQSTGTGRWWDKEWRTGMYKQPRSGPQWLGYEGFQTDEQADPRFHGGVDKAVCVYPSEHLPYWNEINGLEGMGHGAFGENLATLGMLEDGVCIGDIYSLGEARVQVSQPRQPCWKLGRRWQVKDLAAQVERTGKTGFYFRVLQHGLVRGGDSLELRERPFPQWTVELCNRIMHQREGGPEAARALSECPALSGSWKDGLWAMSRARERDSSARTDQP